MNSGGGVLADRSKRQFLELSLKTFGVLAISLWIPQRGWSISAPRVRKARRGVLIDTIFGWGENDFKSLGVTTAGDINSPVVQTASQDWSVIAPGTSVSYFIRSDKTLWTVGKDVDSLGLHGDGTVGGTISSLTQLGTETTWKDIATNTFAATAVKMDGTLWAWGSNASEALGNGGNSWIVTTPKQIASSMKLGSITLIDYHAFYIDGTDKAFGFGSNGSGKLGNASTAAPSTPVQTVGSNWAMVSAGNSFSAGVKNDGTIWFWGARTSGNFGNGTGSSSISTPVNTVAGTYWSKVNVAGNSTHALRNDGTLWAWGGSTDGVLGTGSTTSVTTPTQVVPAATFTKFSNNIDHMMAIRSDGTLWGSGYNLSGAVGDGTGFDVSTMVQAGSATTWVEVSCGYDFTLGIQSDGTMWAWGDNANYCLAMGGADRSTPVKVGTATNWWKVSGGYYAGAALKTDKTLWVWGDVVTFTGGSQYYFSTPVQVGSDTDWEHVSVGYYYMTMQKTNGDIYGMGLVASQDDLNSASKFYLLPKMEQEVSTPVQVGTATNWASVAMGDYQSFAIRTNGTLWQWGWCIYMYDDNYDSGYVRRSTPTQVGSFTNWVKVVSDGSNHLGLRADGTIYGWGAASAALGLGATGVSNDISTPVKIGTATNWVDIATTQYNGLAINSLGELWSWGQNYPASGMTLANRSTPVNTATGTQWTAVSAGALHVIGTKSDKTLWAWGANGDGQLGTSNTTVYSSPVQIGSGATWRLIATGGNKSFGVTNS